MGLGGARERHSVRVVCSAARRGITPFSDGRQIVPMFAGARD